MARTRRPRGKRGSPTRSLVRSEPPATSATTEEPSEREANDALVERSIRALRAIVVTGEVRMRIEAGEYVITHFFGSVAAARERRPDKPLSLRTLVERSGEFGMNATALWRSIQIALQARELGKALSLKMRQEHHLALLPLRDPEEKKVLAESAVESNWTARMLREKVKTLQEPHPGGRPTEPPAAVLARRLDRLLAAYAKADFTEGLAALAPGELRHLHARLRGAAETVQRAARCLEAKPAD